jgi:hypothetical protein
MILKYQKVTDSITTYVLREPDCNEGDSRITELCTIGDDTYVHVPDDVILQEQPFPVETTLEQVVLTDELKKEIKAISPHVQLSYKRLQERIRSKYDIEDEQYLTRISVGNLMGAYELLEGESDLIAEYQAWVEECREIARLERVALGLG